MYFMTRLISHTVVSKKKKIPISLCRSTTVSVRGMKETIVGTGDHTIMDFCLCFKSDLKLFKNFLLESCHEEI